MFDKAPATVIPQITSNCLIGCVKQFYSSACLFFYHICAKNMHNTIVKLSRNF